MHRKLLFGFILTALLAACAETEQSPPADDSNSSQTSAQTFEWKLVMSWPKNLPGLATSAERLAQNIAEMSNNRLTIKVFGAGEYVPAFQVFDAVSSGTAEMGHSAAYYWRGKAPILAVFGTVPFGMTAQETNSWLHYGGGLELWREVYAPFNLIPFPAGNSGVQMAGWFNKEINSLADIQGLKMRIPGLGGDVFQRAGGVAVQLPGNELFTSLQTGVIDATEWVGPYNDLAFGLHDIATYYYYPGWQEPNAVLELMVNKSAYESLPEDLQKIVEVAARASNQSTLDEYTARNMASLNTMMEEHGVQLRKLPDDVVSAFRMYANEVFDELANEDELSARVVASYKDFQGTVSQWHAIAEESYFEIREGNDGS
ncbi:MAG: TRAP transporter substrate-binding protein [Gammaproteobacteria bacterium]|nr:TRAP transporter substrate-binding protein [Gammaproteobacteria bacterium]